MSGTLGLEYVIDQIIAENEWLCTFWIKEAGGWAPRDASVLLENWHMDRLVLLSQSLLISAACRV
jgi:hypothetical protein